MQHTSLRYTSIPAIPAFIAALAAIALCAMLAIAPSTAYAETAAEKQAEAEEALANLNAMQDTLDRLSAEYGEALAAQEAAEEARDAAQTRIDEISDEIADLQDRLGERAREMYRSGGVSFIEILLGARSFEDFATSLDMVNKVNENDANMVAQQKALREEAEAQRAEYAAQAEVAAQKAAEAADAEAQAEATVAEMQAIYDNLSEEAARLLEEERAAQAAAEAARAAAVVAESAGSGYDASADTTAVAYGDGGDTVSRAYSCLGAPYVWGGVGPYGYDCSGLVSYCLTGEHVRLGTTYTFMGWQQVSDPQPGDIAVNWGHTGVYIGGGQMIHAADYGIGVIIGPVQSGMIIVRW
ncbi:MAG: C40 family peptidase [Eggerthellaceae bacterium]|nr:C40 family peptidase [Eggerthellaceae bacterium]